MTTKEKIEKHRAALRALQVRTGMNTAQKSRLIEYRLRKLRELSSQRL